MKLEYILTIETYKAAQILHRKQKLSRQLTVWVWPSLAILALLGTVVFSITHHRELVVDSAAAAAGALFLTIWMPVGRWYNLRKCFKQLFPPARTNRSSFLVIDEEQIVSAVPGVSESRILWRGILFFAQDRKVTMLYTSESRFLFFPTDVLTPMQREDLNEMVNRHGVRNFIC
jgi:hypothetical protein